MMTTVKKKETHFESVSGSLGSERYLRPLNLAADLLKRAQRRHVCDGYC